ncbi:MAG: hypothetical protein DLM67_26065, partial [Candidatus Nephthysia bennettiae]
MELQLQVVTAQLVGVNQSIENTWLLIVAILALDTGVATLIVAGLTVAGASDEAHKLAFLPAGMGTGMSVLIAVLFLFASPSATYDSVSTETPSLSALFTTSYLAYERSRQLLRLCRSLVQGAIGAVVVGLVSSGLLYMLANELTIQPDRLIGYVFLVTTGVFGFGITLYVKAGLKF